MSVKLTVKPNWSAGIENGMKLAILDIATDIHARAIILAPKDTRALVNSGKISPVQDGYSVKFGSERVPYARIQELGGTTGKNGSVTIKGTRYLRKAGEGVAKGNISKYFRGKV